VQNGTTDRSSIGKSDPFQAGARFRLNGDHAATLTHVSLAGFFTAPVYPEIRGQTRHLSGGATDTPQDDTPFHLLPEQPARRNDRPPDIGSSVKRDNHSARPSYSLCDDLGTHRKMDPADR
jgi:hypothetical protein